MVRAPISDCVGKECPVGEYSENIEKRWGEERGCEAGRGGGNVPLEG